MQLSLLHFLLLGAALFSIGLTTVAMKRSALGAFMGVELMLNAATLNLVAFDRYNPAGSGAPTRLDGQVLALFVIVLATAQAAVIVAVILKLHQCRSTAEIPGTAEA